MYALDHYIIIKLGRWYKMIEENPENEKRANEMHESRAAPRSEFWFF